MGGCSSPTCSGSAPRTVNIRRRSGLCGGHDVVASLFVVTSCIDPRELVTVARGAFAVSSDVVVGVSELPNHCGVVARVVGDSSKIVQRP